MVYILLTTAREAVFLALDDSVEIIEKGEGLPLTHETP